MKHHRLSVISIASLAFVTMAMILTVASCGSGSSASSTSTPSASTSSTAASGPAAMVPASIRQTGVLSFGTNIPGTPFEYLEADNTTLTGADIDLGDALAKILGLTPKWTNINWDGLIPALQSKRFEAVMAEMADFTDRQKVVSFVDYLNGGTTLLISKANEGKFTKLEQLAGLKLGVTAGTGSVGVATRVNAMLKAEGKAPFTLLQFSGEGPGILAMQSGRISGYFYDWVSGVYRARVQPSQFAIAFPNMLNATFPYGIAVQKNADGQQLADALQAALNQMIANGSYNAIMAKYGLTPFVVKQATIDGGKTASGA